MKGESGSMKKVLSVLLCLSMLLVVMSASADKLSELKEAGKIRVGANVAFPPYEFYYQDPETGEEVMEGFDVMLARGIGEELGLEHEDTGHPRLRNARSRRWRLPPRARLPHGR